MKSNTIKITLLLASTLTVMSGATIAASLPQIAEVFKNTPNALLLSKLVLTIPAIFVVICSPFLGKLSDKLGRANLLNICLLLYAFSGISGFFLNDLVSILIGRALLGIAVAGISTMVITLVGDFYQNTEREKFIGMQAAFMALGGVVFIGFGGFLASLNWKYPFLIYAFALPILYVSFTSIKVSTVKNKVHAQAFNFRVFKPILKVYLVAFLSMVVFYLIPTQIPFLLKSKNIIDPSQAGIAIAVSTLSGAIVSMNFQKIKQRLTTKYIFIVLFILISFGYFFLSQAQSFYQILISLALSGLGVGLIIPNTNTWLLQIAPIEIRASATGFLTTSIFAGQFLSPILASIIPQNNVSDIFKLTSMGIIAIGLPTIWVLFKPSKLAEV
ncbi:MAG: MFS transporter [Leadbetterella sp.]